MSNKVYSKSPVFFEHALYPAASNPGLNLVAIVLIFIRLFCGPQFWVSVVKVLFCCSSAVKCVQNACCILTLG